MATTNAWLVKSEPGTYSFEKLVKEKSTRWDGIRNFEARNNLRAMKKGDAVLFYHSGGGKEVVGIARVVREAYQDPATKEDWSAVDLEAVKPLAEPVTLEAIKASPKLSSMALVKKGRLSVVPVTKSELAEILRLAKTKSS
jgi:predicted RNA-binding protein with PUA-like domain